MNSCGQTGAEYFKTGDGQIKMRATGSAIRCLIGVSFYFPPDDALQRKAAEKLRKLLRERSFMERWEPLAQEMNWVISGRPNETEHKKLLPDYCYHIFDLYARTIFKTFAPLSEVVTISDKKLAAEAKTIEEARAAMKIDWEKLGAVFSMGERTVVYFENELEPLLKRDGLCDLPPKKNDEIHQLFFGDRWLKAKQSEYQAQNKDKPVEEIIVEQASALAEKTKKAIPDWLQKAREWGPGATTKYYTGAAKGSAGFIDKEGELHGEKKIKHKNTYEILLICWPEIEAMIEARNRMEDLWNWLVPFSHPYWIEIQDLEQLVSLARPIKLKLKEAGRPSKPRKC
jgi:hypothetical protein